MKPDEKCHDGGKSSSNDETVEAASDEDINHEANLESMRTLYRSADPVEVPALSHTLDLNAQLGGYFQLVPPDLLAAVSLKTATRFGSDAASGF